MRWHIAGSYFEACNCDPICPCRRVDGTPGGRSTHGVCMGVLSWVISDGSAGGVDLAGQPVALEAIFTGELGGDATKHFPWAWKQSERIAVRSVATDVEHTRRRQRLRIRDHVNARIQDRYPGDETVSCVIPGHQRTGEELIAERLTVSDEALAFTYAGVCGYASTCDYAG